MKGIIVTDAYGDMDGSQNCDPYFEQVYGILMGGSDIPDGAQPGNEGHFDKFAQNYSAVAWAMRESAKRVCYQTLWSNAMNGISSTTRVEQITPAWQNALKIVTIACFVIFALCLVWTALALVDEYRKKKNA